jgi:hypothetical protein
VKQKPNLIFSKLPTPFLLDVSHVACDTDNLLQIMWKEQYFYMFCCGQYGNLTTANCERVIPEWCCHVTVCTCYDMLRPVTEPEMTNVTCQYLLHCWLKDFFSLLHVVEVKKCSILIMAIKPKFLDLNMKIDMIQLCKISSSSKSKIGRWHGLTYLTLFTLFKNNDIDQLFCMMEVWLFQS